MDFHGVTMQGKLFVDRETTLPVHEAADETRLIYTEDTKTFYYGTDSEWINCFSFKNIKVTGQSDVVADTADDSLTFSGTGGVTIVTDPVTDTVTFSLGDNNVQLILTDDGTSVPVSFIAALLGGEGIDTSTTGNNVVTISAEIATSANKGIASFHPDDFTVTAGVVTINDSNIVHDDISGSGSITHSEIDEHINETSAHGIAGNVVGTTDTQTLANKTLVTPIIGSFINATHNHGPDSLANGGNTLDRPSIADFTNATHDHSDAANGGNTLVSTILTTPIIGSFINATHNHGPDSLANGGNTLDRPSIADFTNATHNHTSNAQGGVIFPRPMLIKLTDDGSNIEVANHIFIFPIPEEFNGMKISQVEAMVSTPSTLGVPTYTLANLTTLETLLSTPVTIDVGLNVSYFTSNRSVVDTRYNTVSTGNLISISKTAVGTGELGDTIIISFRPA